MENIFEIKTIIIFLIKNYYLFKLGCFFLNNYDKYLFEKFVT